MTDDAAAAPQHLPVLPDADWARVLCAVAHPDDMEYGTSAAVATWAGRGVEVTYLLLTAGEAGMDEPPEHVAPLRAREQRAACAAVGVSDLRILDHPDGMLEYGLRLRRDVARVVRQVRPDVVVTANFDLEAYGGLNQADHRVAGLAVVDGVRDAANRWVFRALAEQEGLEPWQARAVLVSGHGRPTHAVQVDEEAVAASVASLASHEAYLRHVAGHPAPEVFVPQMLRAGGRLAGTEYAVTFRVHDLGGLGAKGD
ncbi:N-acetylglucosaminyl deacetylase, LmbE family [Raineyella antarctica]|uniref:N-acetylglucosaminyl deacetylase, LmbE family n=1 Tax=Raineyella antarctica TaxID=1577474 RepID=A0A1G6H3R6_9ACTN|nr:PIG-L deacetylase family protein [Raineyella antarctica]SDB88794.1 N-acetylglucosaminyl deacetylase, LmbE family [Raineyella antarctica]